MIACPFRECCLNTIIFLPSYLPSRKACVNGVQAENAASCMAFQQVLTHVCEECVWNGCETVCEHFNVQSPPQQYRSWRFCRARCTMHLAARVKRMRRIVMRFCRVGVFSKVMLLLLLLCFFAVESARFQ